MDAGETIIRFTFAFVLAMLGVGVLWKGELTVFSPDDARVQQQRRFTGPMVRALGAGWLLAALLGLHSLFACALAFIAVTVGGVLLLMRKR